MGKIGARWTWHYRALMRLNGMLLSRREPRLQLAKDSLMVHRTYAAGSSAIEEEREILLAELTMEEHPIAEVEAALGRIRSGHYGACEVTGKAISADRLRAIPWTRYCRDAAPRRVP